MNLTYESLGDFGKYQCILAFLVILNVPLTMISSISFPFMTKKPNIFCKPKDYMGNFEICNDEDLCKFAEFEYLKSPNDNLLNIAYEFDLYCDNAYIPPIIGTTFFFGSIIGSVILSPIPDKYGREKIYKILILLNSFLNLNLLFSRNIWHVIITTFLLGVASFLYSMSTLIISENFDMKTAGIVQTLNQAIFPITGILIGVFFLFINNWKILFFIVCSFNGIAIYLSQAYMMESPRWLNSQKRYEEVNQIMKKIACINNKVADFDNLFPRSVGLIKIPDITLNKTISKKIQTTFTIIEIFNLKSQRLPMMILTYVWFSAGFCFYGLILNLEKLGGDIFIDSFFTFSGEIFSQIITGYCANKYGRVIVLRTSGILGGFGFIAYSLVSHHLIKSVFIFVTSFGFSATFAIIFIYSPEVFPTSIRSTAIGFLYFISRIGALIVPSVSAIIPRIQLFFGLLAIISSCLCFQLNETLGKEIEDEIPEVKNRKFNKSADSFKLSEGL